MKISVKFLGTGTSHGIPKINCECAVCSSDDPRNRRTRSSLYIEYEGRGVLIDTSADFREQVLRFGVKRLDAIVFTHAHADHLHGIDDIRAFQKKDSPPIECYAIPAFCEEVRHRFDYIFLGRMPIGGGTPRVNLTPVTGPFDLFGLEFEPLEVVHGEKETAGFRFGRCAYVPDFKTIPAATLEKMKNLDVLIIDALRYRPHLTHSSVSESLEVAAGLSPSRTYFTHIDHEIEHEIDSEKLAGKAFLAYDGLVVESEC